MQSKSTQLDNERTRNGTNIGSSWGMYAPGGHRKDQDHWESRLDRKDQNQPGTSPNRASRHKQENKIESKP